MVSLRTRCALLVSSACVLSAQADFLERVVVLQQWTGERAGDQFGWVTARCGDQDGDGIDDMLITAPTNDEGGGNAGKVYVYSSVTGQLLNSFTGLRNNDQGSLRGAHGSLLRRSLLLRSWGLHRTIVFPC